jgi:hypothetical protein
MPPAGFKPAIPAGNRQHTLALDRSATRIGRFDHRTVSSRYTDWAIAAHHNRIIPLTVSYLTPWIRVLPEKLKRPELLKKFPAFYGTRRFITAFTTARHLSLSWATLIQSMPPPPSNLSQVHFNIILPSTPGSKD